MRELEGALRHYMWGSTDVIPGLLGIEPTGEPFAELWLGAHESESACTGGEPLRDLLARSPELLGEATRGRFGKRLPYLLKVISAAGPMSLQAHPDAAAAALGYRRETDADVPLEHPKRIYKDPHPKDELIIATGDVHALCGFRDPLETYRLFSQLPMKVPLDHLIGGLAHRGGAPALAEVFLNTLTYDDSRQDLVHEVVVAAFERMEAPGELGELARTAVELDRFFPGERAILAALLMHSVHLSTDQALHIPAGTMHSVLHGTAVEMSGSSDNVVRGGLTRKHINVDELISVVDFTPGPPARVDPVQDAPGVFRYEVPVSEFRGWRLAVTADPVPVPATALPRLLLVLSGEVSASGSGPGRLTAGSAAFLDAGEQVELSGEAVAYLAAPGTAVAGTT